MAIDFLCTRVMIQDEDDWGNLLRVLGYIRGTPHIPLILRADSLSFIKWWVDASFSAHPDCKGRTGAMIYMGSGSIMELSRKKKNKWEDLNGSQCSGRRQFLVTVPVVEIINWGTGIWDGGARVSPG